MEQIEYKEFGRFEERIDNLVLNVRAMREEYGALRQELSALKNNMSHGWGLVVGGVAVVGVFASVVLDYISSFFTPAG